MTTTVDDVRPHIRRVFPLALGTQEAITHCTKTLQKSTQEAAYTMQ
jgi:hypothetical protein